MGSINNTRTVLVTGGAGYIGSHTCKQLRAKGFEPVVYDNLSRGHREFVKWGPLIEGDLHDEAKLISAFREFRPVAVLHFAAFAYVGESMRLPLLYYRNNVGGTVALLNAMQVSGVDKLVFSSTCATYGTPEDDLIRESTAQNPVNPYGRSKLMVEKILQDAALNGLKSIALRYFNAAGADLNSEIGEWHEPETHLLPLTLLAAQNDSALSIFGSDYPTYDGTCVRDYIHVEDLAEAHILALARLLEKDSTNFEAFNLGTGRGYSVLEIVEAVERVTKRSIRRKLIERREGDPAKLVADPALAQATLEWQPRRSDLETIVTSANNWLTKNRG